MGSICERMDLLKTAPHLVIGVQPPPFLFNYKLKSLKIMKTFLFKALVHFGKELVSKKAKTKGQVFYQCRWENLTNKGPRTFKALLSESDYNSLNKSRIAFFEYNKEGHHPSWRKDAYKEDTVNFVGGKQTSVATALESETKDQKAINKHRDTCEMDWES